MEEWKECKLGDICKSNIDSYSEKDNWTFVNYLDTGNITENKISDIQFIDLSSESLPSRARRKVQLNDIIYSTVRPNQKHFGIIKNQPENFLVSTGFAVLHINKTIADPNFIFYNLIQNENTETLHAIAEQTTSAYPAIKPSDIENLSIKLPPLPSQQKIAAILSSLDDKIELNNKINTNLEQQAQALFKNWFVDFEPFGGEMPEEWKEKALYDYADFINGTSFKEYEYGTEGLPIIKIAELKNGITDTTQYFNGEKDPKYNVENEDILFSWSGNPDTSIDIFIWSLGNGILNQHTFNVKSHTNNKWFTYCLLKYFKPEFCHRASCKQTTGLGHVTTSDLKQITFSSSEKAESDFENLITPIMKQIFNNKLENQKLVILRDTLLPKLMNGEIEV